MHTIAIAFGHHRGKHIQVTKYARTVDGIDIVINHNVPTVTGKQLQWVQTVTSNNGLSRVCKIATRVDPFNNFGGSFNVPLPAMPGLCMADDLLPFYWTAGDLARGSGPGFSDGPSMPPPAHGRTWSNFTTALTEVTGQDVHHLVAISWGYDRMADGSVRANVIRRATMAEMKAHGHSLKVMYPDYKYT